MAAPSYNVFVGAETGILKGVDVSKRVWGNLNKLDAVDRQHEIVALCWGEEGYQEICVGSRNRMVSILDVESLEFTGSCHLPGGEGVFRGLARCDSCFISAAESGLVSIWDEKASEPTVTFDAGKDIWRMRQNPGQHEQIATGGKENDLKIWDLEHPESPIFAAKNVRNDWLNLRVPVWVMDMAFIPDSNKIATVTGHHQLRIYDPSTQRRPVIDVEFDEYPITSLGLRHGYNQLVIGNTHGKMALMDLRKGQMVQCYKGFAGSIRDIACHPSAPVVASCGLDRFLRIHHIDSRALISKFYLKSRLNCMLMTSEWGGKTEDQATAGNIASDSIAGENDTDDDKLWENMEELHEKTVKRDRTVKRKITDDKISQKKTKIKAGQTKKKEKEESNEEDHEGVETPSRKSEKIKKRKKRR